MINISLDVLTILEMEFVGTDQTLLALLLTLRNAETPLSEQEITQLYEVGEQIKLIPEDWEEDWEFIKQDLMDIITANPELNQQFQNFLTQLETQGNQLTPELLPTDAELKQQLPTQETIKKRGFPPGQSPKSFTQALMNDVVVPVLFDDNPPEVTKKLSFLERLQQTLQNSSGDDFTPPMNV